MSFSTSHTPPHMPTELQIQILQFAAFDSSHVEGVTYMLISKRVYDVVCSVVYHTIVLHHARMCDGFAALLASKPPAFRKHTQALYMSTFDGSESISQWTTLWTRIIPHLPYLCYLEGFSLFPYSESLRQIAIETLECTQSLNHLTLDGGLTILIASLFEERNPPIFPRVTHLKFSYWTQILGSIEMIFLTPFFKQSFPRLSHLKLQTILAHTRALSQCFTELKVLILVVHPHRDNLGLQEPFEEFPNTVIWDTSDLTQPSRFDRLEEFLNDVMGEQNSIWNRAQRVIAGRGIGKMTVIPRTLV
ncbi:hypothetical protein DL96DRAFT_1714712 [Flagelloscypha sp. PMI_526]|nr:hypothetical protein DL96DRAFT_1714712 [Flagelloscypha sp. PMI_526]